MQKRTHLILFPIACLALLALVTAVSPVPAAITHSATANAQETAQTQSITGKIASVGKNTFTLTVDSGVASNPSQFGQSTPKSMTFQVDKNTTIDGKLEVGSTANVTYRVENGNNIAVNVRVS
jgi:hypothetical protein